MLPGCPFFHDKMQNYPFAAEHMKRKFCLGDNTDCARHRIRVGLGSEAVPDNLFPNDNARADGILADAGATEVIASESPHGEVVTRDARWRR
jgi:hypothetical protein